MKIGWILSSNRNNAGSRIHGWNMHDVLSDKGVKSEIIYYSKKYKESPEFSEEELQKIIEKEFDLIVFVGFKSDQKIVNSIQFLQKNNIKIIYIKTDTIPQDLIELSDASIFVSEFAKSEMPLNLQKKITVIFDGYEHNAKLTKEYTCRKKIKLVYVCNNVHNKFPQIEKLPVGVSLKIIGPPKKRIDKFMPGKTLFTETPYDFEYLVWNLKTIEKDILDCDVAVIPYSDKHLKTEFIHRKSANRLVLFMSYGLPVIVSPTREYARIIKSGENGFIANSKEDWQDLIQRLRDNPELRKRIGLAGRKSVVEKYSKESQAKKYLNVFKKTLQ